MKTINICGVPHTIKLVEDGFCDNSLLGQISFKDAEILINSASVEAVQKEILCHEIMHGILNHIGRQDLSNDETFIQALGNAVYQSFEPIIDEVEE